MAAQLGLYLVSQRDSNDESTLLRPYLKTFQVVGKLLSRVASPIASLNQSKRQRQRTSTLIYPQSNLLSS